MIKKGRLDALRSFWERYPAEFDASTLATAAAAGQDDVIRFLLVEARLDPAAAVPGTTEGRRAYDMCAGRGARNVFRRVRHEFPEMYDWAGAHVPEGLSEEMEEKQESKKAERRKGLKEKMKEREKARGGGSGEDNSAASAASKGAEVEGEAVVVNGATRVGPTQKLGGRDVGGLAGMSEEMRIRVERERRARAAEERFKRLAGGGSGNGGGGS